MRIHTQTLRQSQILAKAYRAIDLNVATTLGDVIGLFFFFFFPKLDSTSDSYLRDFYRRASIFTRRATRSEYRIRSYRSKGHSVPRVNGPTERVGYCCPHLSRYVTFSQLLRSIVAGRFVVSPLHFPHLHLHSLSFRLPVLLSREA